MGDQVIDGLLWFYIVASWFCMSERTVFWVALGVGLSLFGLWQMRRQARRNR